jgi:hypothetical protein
MIHVIKSKMAKQVPASSVVMQLFFFINNNNNNTGCYTRAFPKELKARRSMPT